MPSLTLQFKTKKTILFAQSRLILLLLTDYTCSPTEGKDFQTVSTNIYTSLFTAVFLA